MTREKTLDYVEFFAPDLTVIKNFYSKVFNWKFTDFGPNYVDFFDGSRHGGFTKGEVKSGSTLVVLYSDELETMQEKIMAHGGKISVEIFTFPGGQRFQFIDPAGNELGVWSEKK